MAIQKPLSKLSIRDQASVWRKLWWEGFVERELKKYSLELSSEWGDIYNESVMMNWNVWKKVKESEVDYDEAMNWLQSARAQRQHIFLSGAETRLRNWGCPSSLTPLFPPSLSPASFTSLPLSLVSVPSLSPFPPPPYFPIAAPAIESRYGVLEPPWAILRGPGRDLPLNAFGAFWGENRRLVTEWWQRCWRG